MIRKALAVSLLTIFAMLVLTACGGGSEPTPEPTNTPAPEPTATPEPAPQAEESDDASSAEGETPTTATGMRTFVIVPEESTASYSVEEEFFQGAVDRLGVILGLVDTVGSTQEIEGQLQLNLDDLSSALGDNQFTVNIESLTSDQPRRDQRIREANLESSKYPLATFSATAIEGAPDSYSEGEEVSFQLVGDITIREITQPVTFDITASLSGDTISGMATALLTMTDFGFDPPNFADMFTVEDEFTVEVEFTARENQ
jgi:polyisoprenoid-binding protein YceI